MALPADFAKIFGSTFTGGLTPIADVDYSKGWEFVGSNPPTKNDFSYLQNLSDLKSQWIYNYLIDTSNAASRVVGTGSGQIPDMSSFAKQFGGLTGYQKLPSGLIIQWGASQSANGTTGVASIVYPISFPTATMVVLTVELTAQTTGFGGVSSWGWCAETASRNGTNVINTVPAAIESCRYIALGY